MDSDAHEFPPHAWNERVEGVGCRGLTYLRFVGFAWFAALTGFIGRFGLERF